MKIFKYFVFIVLVLLSMVIFKETACGPVGNAYDVDYGDVEKSWFKLLFPTKTNYVIEHPGTRSYVPYNSKSKSGHKHDNNFNFPDFEADSNPYGGLKSSNNDKFAISWVNRQDYGTASAPHFWKENNRQQKSFEDFESKEESDSSDEDYKDDYSDTQQHIHKNVNNFNPSGGYGFNWGDDPGHHHQQSVDHNHGYNHNHDFYHDHTPECLFPFGNQERPSQDRPPQGRPLQGRPPQDRPPQDRPPQNRPPQNRPPQDRPPQNRPPQDRPPQNRPPQNRPPQDRPPQNRPPQDRLPQVPPLTPPTIESTAVPFIDIRFGRSTRTEDGIIFPKD